MCLIIQKTAKQKLETMFINDVWSSNPHGWGVFYYMGGQLQIEKGMDVASFYKTLDTIKDREAMIHFRYATHGVKSIEMAHPFHIIDDIWMMHNGVLSGKDYQCPEDKKSDTALFAELVKEILQMTSDPSEFIRSEKFQQLIAPEINGSSIVFADNFGFVPMEGSLDYKTTCGLVVSNGYAYSYNNPDDRWAGYKQTYYGGGWGGHGAEADWKDDPNYDPMYSKHAWWEVDDFIDRIENMSYEDILQVVKDEPNMITDVLMELDYLRKKGHYKALPAVQVAA